MEKDNLVEKPAHYYEGRKYAPWDVIDDWRLDFYRGTAVKYIARAGRKTPDARQDIQKAIRCLEYQFQKFGNQPMVGEFTIGVGDVALDWELGLSSAMALQEIFIGNTHMAYLYLQDVLRKTPSLGAL